MITYNPFWETLKKRNISTYCLEREYGMNKATIYRLKHNHSITMQTLNQLCETFDCGINDIIEYVKDSEQNTATEDNKKE